MKEYKNNEELIDYLISKNVTINDKEKALENIKKYSYYSIINGYKSVFKDEDNNYKENTTFEEIFALYEFDKNIKAIFLKYILEIEVVVKSLMANILAEEYGVENYLKLEHFDANADEELVRDFILKIEKEIEDNYIKHPAIKHYKDTYDFVPPFVLTKILTFGAMSKYYSLLKQNDGQKICLISFTSGTTSSSKAVMLSHKNICSNMISSSKVFSLTEKDICLSVLPLNHVLEGLFCMLQSIYNGLERVFCNEIDEITDYIKNYKITFMCGVPAIYEYLYKRKDELIAEVHHINLFMSGGAKLNNELVEKYKELGINLVQGYGITECGPVVSLENKDNKRPHSARKNYSKCRS